MDSVQQFKENKLSLNGIPVSDLENAFRHAMSQKLIVDSMYFITELGTCVYLWNYNLAPLLEEIMVQNTSKHYLDQLSSHMFYNEPRTLYTLLQSLLHFCADELNITFTPKEFNSLSEQIFTTVINEQYTSPRNSDAPKYKWTIPTPTKYYRMLRDDSPQLDWDTIARTNMLNCHWPQRKLLFAYLELLTELQRTVNMSLHRVSVIYSGASPGHHIPLIIKFFRCAQWILVQSPGTSASKWDTYLTNNAKKLNTVIVESLEHAKTLIQPDTEVLLICDTHFGTDVHNALNMQREIVNIINPKYMFLRFKLPYDVHHVKYFNGRVYPCIWSAPFSTESTLFVHSGSREEKQWDTKKYNDQMHYYNQVLRQTRFENPLKMFIPGYDDSYECKVEFEIIKNMLHVLHLKKNPIVIVNGLNEIMQWVSKRTIIGCIPYTIDKNSNRSDFKLYIETFLWYFNYSQSLNSQKNIILNKILKTKESGNLPPIRPHFKPQYADIEKYYNLISD